MIETKYIKKIGRIISHKRYRAIEGNANLLNVINPDESNFLKPNEFVDVLREVKFFGQIYYICAKDSKCYILGEREIKIYNY